MRSAFWLNIVVKASLVLLLAFGAFSGLERFAGKAFGWRLIGYSIAALIVPAIWAARGRRSPYPYASDILFVLPFLIDTIGNALDLYDTIGWWDDANHFVNWALLSGALAAALARTHIRGAELFGLVVGFGAVTAILWEIGEYFAFIRNSSALDRQLVQDGRALKIVLEGQEKRVVLRELLQGALRLVVEILVVGKLGQEVVHPAVS
jgi:hypothetical protein